MLSQRCQYADMRRIRIDVRVIALANCNSFNSQFFDISQQPFHRFEGTYPPMTVEISAVVRDRLRGR